VAGLVLEQEHGQQAAVREAGIMIVDVTSISGGIDSLATELVRRETSDHPAKLVCADTGNEHPLWYEYMDYLREKLGPIDMVRADFSERIANKRKYVEEVWPTEGIADGVVRRAIAALVPRGNPFLDLCIWKGRFPSRKAQFCTQFLKTEPLVDYQIDIIDQGNIVWSWQGVRADESLERRNRPSHEEVGGGLWIERPILKWPKSACFEAGAYFGILPNPLYLQGMGRVGCSPCINTNKDELAETAKRWPEIIDIKAEWEWIVAQASKRGLASFFPAPNDGRGALRGRDIRTYVKWAMTSHGGLQYDLEKAMPAKACASSYGLCE
jgi:3'-phosphoadenosine 5'-phosphosulfate sulfotransferase (PAPS reductase)/FAD synthetase